MAAPEGAAEFKRDWLRLETQRNQHRPIPWSGATGTGSAQPLFASGNIFAKQSARCRRQLRQLCQPGNHVYKAALKRYAMVVGQSTGNALFRRTANFGGDRITGHRSVESFKVPGELAVHPPRLRQRWME
jgi:hypothetical protein